MSSGADEINPAEGVRKSSGVEDNIIAVQDRTDDVLKLVILNEDQPTEWIESDPDKAVDLEEVR